MFSKSFPGQSNHHNVDTSFCHIVYLQPNKACSGSHRREKAPRTSDVALDMRHSICHYLQTILTTSKSSHFSVLEHITESKICPFFFCLGAQLKISLGFELPLMSLPCSGPTSPLRALHGVSLHLLQRVSGLHPPLPWTKATDPHYIGTG